MNALTIREAAAVKFVSGGRIERAIEQGVLGGAGGRVVWDERFESWMPTVAEEDLSYRVNMVRTYSTTIRIDVPLLDLAREASATARAQAAEWSLVPVRRENMDLILGQQRGSIDGNVYTEYLEDDVREALRMGKSVYQKRIHTGMVAYTQRLHPAPAVLPAHSVAATRGDQANLGRAIEQGEIAEIRYHDALLVVDDERLTSWREHTDNHHDLFSQGLLRA